MTALTWNPADKSVDMGLENGNLDAVKGGVGSSAEGVRGNISRTSGSLIIEYKVIATRVPDDIIVGLANSSLGFSDALLGNGNVNLFWRGGGAVEVGGFSAGTLAYGEGDVLTVAVKPASGKVWIRKNGGAWLGGGDPAADTTPTGTYPGGNPTYPLHVTDDCPPDDYRVRIQGDFSNIEGSIPSGFEPFGDSGVVDVFRGALQTKWEKAKAGFDWALSSPLTLLSALVGTPLRPFEWPVPRGYQRAVSDWAAPPSLSLLTATVAAPLRPLEFVVPRGAVFPIGMRSWALNLQQTTLRVDFSMCTGYPNASDVRDGVQYGPNGNDFTGTLTGGAGGGWILRRR